MTTHETFQGEIIDLTTMGDGIAKHEGKTVFVTGATIGDKAEIEIVKKKDNYFLGQIVKLIEPSPFRVKPRCKHFGVCGSCQLQNLSYAGQLKYKQNFVKQALNRIGGIDIEIQPIVPAEEYFYRNKIQLPFSDKKGGELGYFKLNSHDVVDLEECFLQEEDLTTLALGIKEYVRAHKVSIYNEEKNTGLLRHLFIRKSDYDKKLLVGIVINGREIPDQENFIKAVLALQPKLKTYQIDSLILNFNRSKTNKILGEWQKVIHGPGFIMERIGDKLFKISLTAFTQINRLQAEKIYTNIAKSLTDKNKLIIDAYCGIGTIALNVADKAARVCGIETNPQAVLDALSNAKLNNIDNAEFIQAAVETVPSKQLKGADVFIVDPPRKGLEQKVIETIRKLSPQSVFYVSCNPATLARDLKILMAEGQYILDEVKPYDLFPQTTHIEVLAKLSIAKA